MDEFILIVYILSLSVLFLFGCHGFVMVYYLNKFGKNSPLKRDEFMPTQPVTVQLPIFNEYYVVDRLIDTICELDYPKELLEIQVLDDSTDETAELAAELVKKKQDEGFDIHHIRRGTREGYKAGALKEGTKIAKGEFIAIFDADFVPQRDFLLITLPYFSSDKIGMVQTRWEHLNSEYSLLTKAQALALDGHFAVEQNVRSKAGFFINFNGTAGIWRKSCIEDAGHWQGDTLTEDLDLSFRAQLKGWKFVFLNDYVSPAELPSQISAFKSQQFRWTKGAIETAKKLLPKLWKADIPFRVKSQAVFHLVSNIVFPFILVAAILNVPLVFIKNNGLHDTYFMAMSVFVIAFIGSFIFYLYSQKNIRSDWRKRIAYFPLFMAGSMGLSFNNSRAVFEGLFNRRSEFVRTPKFKVLAKSDSWRGKKYTGGGIDFSVVIELLLALYCLIGIIAAVYYLEIAAIPFQLLFFGGFAAMALMSINHAKGKSRE